MDSDMGATALGLACRFLIHDAGRLGLESPAWLLSECLPYAVPPSPPLRYHQKRKERAPSRPGLETRCVYPLPSPLLYSVHTTPSAALPCLRCCLPAPLCSTPSTPRSLSSPPLLFRSGPPLPPFRLTHYVPAPAHSSAAHTHPGLFRPHHVLPTTTLGPLTLRRLSLRTPSFIPRMRAHGPSNKVSCRWEQNFAFDVLETPDFRAVRGACSSLLQYNIFLMNYERASQ
ncbi:hypothetical protein C8J57DRAFT_1706051 [Mycena rebaudengoi]|nr:hypothetical protein C8J57DRAFT_1706051 [Mycena rebaudengoi]